MPGYRDQRMLRRKLLPKERLNMILMPIATTMVIITVRDMIAAIITEKDMIAAIIMETAGAAAIRRVTMAAAITESKAFEGSAG